MNYGMRGFVLEDHDSSTTGRAHRLGAECDQLELMTKRNPAPLRGLTK